MTLGVLGLPSESPDQAAAALRDVNRPRLSGLEADQWAHSRIGRAIRRRRKLLGLSLRDLAQACGISLQQIQKYEVGASSISAAQLWKVAYALSAPVEYFFEPLATARPIDAGDLLASAL
jgi:ribosome-binding protein aMBF1 (putative translation factor)